MSTKPNKAMDTTEKPTLSDPAGSGSPQAPCSALLEALDDGQEVKMHRFWNPSENRDEYLVRIYGDCHIEAERESLDDAVNTAVAHYRTWKETVE